MAAPHDGRKISIALLGSLAVHVLLVCAIVLYLMINSFFIGAPEEGDLAAEDEEPDELVIEMPEILKPLEVDDEKDGMLRYVRTSQNDPADRAPDDPSFQSDRDTLAATEDETDPNGERSVPSQSGEKFDEPVIELAEREYVDGEIGDDRTEGQPLSENVLEGAPSEAVELDTPPDPTEQPEQSEAVAATPPQRVDGADDPLGEAEKLATPPEPQTEFAQDPTGDVEIAVPDIVNTVPEIRRPEIVPEALLPRAAVEGAVGEPSDAPDATAANEVEARPPSRRPRTGQVAPERDTFQPQTRKSEIVGTISNRGKSAVDSANTPLGRYMKTVTGAIEKEWHRKRMTNADFVTYGSIRLQFFVNENGEVEELRIANPDKANALMQDFTLSAVLEAKIPKMPGEILNDLTGDRLPVTYDIIIY